MNRDHSTAGVSRRTWRAAVVLFLVVFLGGLGLSGATALWSQQGTVQATVSTGSWTTEPRAGWDWNPEVAATTEKVNGRHHLRLSWTEAETSGSSVSYQVTFQGLGPARSGSVGTPTVEYVLEDSADRQFTFTVTASVDGIPSRDVVRYGTVTTDGQVTLATT